MDKLETTPSLILANYIIDVLGKFSWPQEGGSWPLYVSHMPDGGNVEADCGTIYDTSAVLDGRLMSGLLLRWIRQIPHLLTTFIQHGLRTEQLQSFYQLSE